MDLADWARWFVSHWRTITTETWSLLLSWTGLRVSEFFASILTLWCFATATVIAARRVGPDAPWKPTSKRLLRGKKHNEKARKWVPILFASYGIFTLVILYMTEKPTLADFVFIIVVVTCLCFMVWLFVDTILKINITVGPFRGGGFLLLHMLILSPFIYSVLVSLPANLTGDPTAWIYALLLSVTLVLPLPIMSAIAPIHGLNRRLSFLAIGALLLIGLNQLSLHGSELKELLKPPP
jgi:hypothetical protein